MLAPDQRLFESDLQSAEYRNGVAKGLWDQADGAALPDDAAWPNAYFWMAAAPRTGAPDRYYVALNLSGYRSVPPTGPFWDPVKKQTAGVWQMAEGQAEQPVRDGVQDGRIFRGRYARFITRTTARRYQDHPQWRTEQPHLVWTSSHTIVNYLEEFQSLLTCGDYIGV